MGENDFLVGYTIFYKGYFKTYYRHFDNLDVAIMFCKNKSLNGCCKLYVDYEYMKKGVRKNGNSSK